MTALCSGDDRALNLLMQRWEMPVKVFIARFGVLSDEVEDVAQETFVRLYQTRARFREGARFKSWLLTLAGNLARNRLRWWKRRPLGARLKWELETSLMDRETTAASRGQELDLEYRAQQVRMAIDGLPPKLRQVVLCVEIEAMSHAEAAQVLDCSVKAVETRLYRARAQLRKGLESIGDVVD